jgi:hypothetical protein
MEFAIGNSRVLTLYDMLPTVIWIAFPSTIGLSITILVHRLQTHNSTSWYVPLRGPFHSFMYKTLNFLLRAFNFCVGGLIPIVLFLFLLFVECIISMDLQSEEMQLVGQWAPLVGVGLVLVAAFVGKYWPRGERLLLRFRERREIVRRSGIKEGVGESLSWVWKERHERSTWSYMGIALLQGDDLE